MRKIGIRQFQQHLHEELKNIPFIVTTHGEDYFMVMLPQFSVVASKPVKPSKKSGTLLPFAEISKIDKNKSILFE